MIYTHDYSLIATVTASTQPDGFDITAPKLRRAFMDRLNSLDDGELFEAVGTPVATQHTHEWVHFEPAKAIRFDAVSVCAICGSRIFKGITRTALEWDVYVNDLTSNED